MDADKINIESEENIKENTEENTEAEDNGSGNNKKNNIKESDNGSRFSLVFEKIKKALFGNIGYKLLSVALAIGLWAFVLSTDEEVTRRKTVEVLIAVENEQALSNNLGLVISSDKSVLEKPVEVTITSNVNDVVNITPATVNAMIDLSQVKTKGETRLPIVVEHMYGTAYSASPFSITLDFEEKASVDLPVEVNLIGKREDEYWYNVKSVVPEKMQIVGPKSKIELIEKLVVDVDVSQKFEPFKKSLPVTVIDIEGNEMENSIFITPPANCIMEFEVYPKKTVTIDTESVLMNVDELRAGYKIEGIPTTTPVEVQIAGPAEILSEIESIKTDTISLEDKYQSFSTNELALQIPESVVWSNYKTVSMFVQIKELQSSATMDDFYVKTDYLSSDLKVSMLWGEEPNISITFSGPKSLIDKLNRKTIIAQLNLANYGIGTFTLPVEVILPEEFQNKVKVKCVPSELSVTIEKK